MIRGIGVDVVTVARMNGMIERHGDRLARRILAPSELDEYQRYRGADPGRGPPAGGEPSPWRARPARTPIDGSHRGYP